MCDRQAKKWKKCCPSIFPDSGQLNDFELEKCFSIWHLRHAHSTFRVSCQQTRRRGDLMAHTGQKVVLWMHVCCFFATYGIWGLLFLLRNRFPQMGIYRVELHAIVVSLAIFSSVSGCILMSLRRAKNESIVLAITTTAAFAALFLLLSAIA